MKKIAVSVAQCYWYDNQPGSCAKSRSLLMVLGYFPLSFECMDSGKQGHFSPMSLLMIYAWSLYVLPFDTNLELVHAGDREEQDRMQESLAVKGFT